MKKLIFLLPTLLLAYFAQGQNTFENSNAEGNVGIGTLSPSAYGHGGNNRILEIKNANSIPNSQSHLMLSTGFTGPITNSTSIGSLSWVAPGAASYKIMGYIGGILTADVNNSAIGNIAIATANGGVPQIRMTIAANGNVGVGTFEPVRLFTVSAPTPEFVLQDIGRPVDQKNYRIYTHDNVTVFGTLNDAGTSGKDDMVIDQLSGNVTIGGKQASSYTHGGNNRVMEIWNHNTANNSQAHLMLSSGATGASSSIGTISWALTNSNNNQLGAYIGSRTTSVSSTAPYTLLTFATANGGLPTEKMTIMPDGNVGIGTAEPGDNKLAVSGTIAAKRVKVTASGWADYVFAPGYELPTFAGLEQFIASNGHLPGIPSAASLEKEGLDIGDMQKRQMEKIEELALLLIQLNKQVEKLEEKVTQQQAVIEQQQQIISKNGK
ncbi:hypothetical protein [Chitinophaga sp. sic0106]|uniref:hypothetical protein n=1 Tax=Chitinophaga sp. sic0106 TaxID=2854785 RepID=UPI001C45F60E|nr:hypothetical protein [Chitinophaga sp. sic0106]MBV7531179.1 hypothetical protein [Chitinophaga sp. sic0106]